MKKNNHLFFITSIILLLLYSCGVVSNDSDSVCDAINIKFDIANDDVRASKNRYTNDPNPENCKMLKEDVQAYLLAIAALTTVDYCVVDREDVNGETFAAFLIQETLDSQKTLEELEDQCPD